MTFIELEYSGAATSRRWRNTVTGECRSTPPQPGELDWVEVSSLMHCPD